MATAEFSKFAGILSAAFSQHIDFLRGRSGGLVFSSLLEFSTVYCDPHSQCCESAALNMPANLENSAVATGLEKVHFHSNLKKGNAKECSNYCTIALISYASKVMLKILQARLQQYVNRELPDVQVGFRKGRGTRDQIVNVCWIIEKAREFQ